MGGLVTHAAAWSDSDLPRPKTPIAELAGARELIGNLVLRELRSKYRRTVLGHAWSLVNPIAQIAIFSIVFAYLLRIRADQSANSDLDVFALWLSAGLLPWIYFSTTVNTGLSVLVGNANLIKKVYFPRAALLVATGSPRLTQVFVVCEVRFAGDVDPAVGRPRTNVEAIIADPTNEITPNQAQSDLLNRELLTYWRIVEAWSA